MIHPILLAIIALSFLSLVLTVDLTGDISLSTYTSAQAIKITNVLPLAYYIGQGICYSDVNNDGLKDLIIGSSITTYNGRSNPGMVSVIFGTPAGFGDFDLSSLTSVQGYRIYGAGNSDYIGGIVLCPGDLNGDTINDIVIGSPGKDFAGPDYGAVYVVFGQASGNTDVDLASLTAPRGITITLSGAASSTLLGMALGAANVYGDSRNELLLGAPGPAGGQGSVYVVYASSIGTSNIDLSTASYGYRIDGPVAGYRIGNAISYAGDFNDDGIDDFIIGAPTATASSRSGSGIAYVVYGGATSNLNAGSLGSQGFQILGAAANDALGSSVSYAGDINHDGLPDILLGASQAVSGAGGMSYVIYGKSGGYSSIDLSILSTQGFKISGFSGNGNNGHYVSNAGDINGDSIDDFLVGTPGFDVSGTQNVGSLFVILGKQGTFSNIDLADATTYAFPTALKITGAAASDFLGKGGGYAGDVNGDGYNDILVRSLPASFGTVYLIYGGPLSYKYWDGTYVPSCQLPLVRREVLGTGIVNCDYPCTNSADYLYWDGTCAACAAPLSSRTTKGKFFCDFPCTNTNDYLYWDASCSSTCNAPLSPRLANGRSFCDFPCTNSADHLYWDGTCAACAAPLSPRTTQGKSFCDFPCTNTNDYLYKDGSCSSICNEPLWPLTNNGKSFCDLPCANIDDYLYWNGSCIPFYCPAPMIIQHLGDTRLCKKPCVDDSLYYYTGDQACRPQCSQPYHATVTEYGKACSITASPQDVEDINNMGQAMNVATSVSSNGFFALNLMAPGFSAAATTVSLSKMIAYTRYLNITTSPRLKLLYDKLKFDYGLPYVPGVPSSIKDAYPYQPVLPMFNQYNISGSFLVNFWKALMTISIVVVIFILILILDYRGRRGLSQKFIWKVISQLRIIAQNMIITQFYETLGDLFLFAFLEFHTQIYGSAGFNLSLCLSIVFTIVGLGVLVFHFLLLKKYRNFMNTYSGIERDEQLNVFEEKQAGFRVLFEDFKDATFVSQAYLLFFMVRVVFFQIMLISLNISPFTQILLISISTTAMMIYLFRILPYKWFPEFLQAIALELIFLIVNISLLEIGIMDMSQVQFTYIHYYLGETVIFCNLICHYIPILFIGLKVIWLIKTHWKIIKLLVLKILVELGMNIPLGEQNAQLQSHSNIQKMTFGEIIINAMNNTKVSPISPTSVEIGSQPKSLIKTDSRPQSSEAIPKLQSQLSTERASISPDQQLLGRKYHLKPAITQISSIQIPEDPKDIESQSQPDNKHNNQVLSREKDGLVQIDGPSLPVPTHSSDVSRRRREPTLNLDRPFEGNEKEVEELSSPNYLLNSHKKIHFEDEITFFEEGMRKQDLQINKANRTLNAGRLARTGKSLLDQSDTQYSPLKVSKEGDN